MTNPITTPDELAEQAIGLIAQASYRANKERGPQAEIDLLESVSAFTTKLHIEARKRHGIF